jgi:hypothetical protein
MLEREGCRCTSLRYAMWLPRSLVLVRVLVTPSPVQFAVASMFVAEVSRSPCELTVTLSQLQAAVQQQPPVTQWAVLLFRAGYFAGAIFQDSGAKLCHTVAHKCFQRYTVRKKQGGAQSTHDAEGGRARSAGSWLRRQNTIALRDDIHALLEAWKSLLAGCTRIFIAASKRSVSTLFCDTLRRGGLIC